MPKKNTNHFDIITSDYRWNSDVNMRVLKINHQTGHHHFYTNNTKQVVFEELNNVIKSINNTHPVTIVDQNLGSGLNYFPHFKKPFY